MDVLNPPDQLTAGQSITSNNGRLTLVLQGDGNLVLYAGGVALWSPDAHGNPAQVAKMQTDGNFVLYDGQVQPLWASDTAGHPGSLLKVQDDGNVVIYEGLTPIWATGTDAAANILVGKSSSSKFRGVYGENTAGGDGVFGFGPGSGRGVVGVSDTHVGVEGGCPSGTGVFGSSTTGIGVRGSGDAGQGGLAAFFEGNVTVTGNILAPNSTLTCFDVSISGGDCAEEFNLAGSDATEPGTVLSLDSEGTLCVSRQAYDKKVAGVVSGAGAHKPGIVLDKQPSPSKRAPIALVGKVCCKVDASYSPIEVGDLLTTSATPGHAMKVENPLRAFGAVIGKALRPLPEGKGLIPILVALQ
jgi:hypothetical protein